MSDVHKRFVLQCAGLPDDIKAALLDVIKEAEERGWNECVKGVEMTRDTFREGTASRATCEVVLADLRKLAALPRGS